ncbi:MAG: cobalamin-dependent protein [Thermodesulfobacteriota bacterium]
MKSKGRIRILIAKPGLDTHDRGAKMIARACKDAGMEVIYLKPKHTVDNIISAAIEEDVDIIGLSILSGTHMEMCSGMVDKMKKQNLNLPIILGGIIPKSDIPLLKRLGIKEVFRSGVHTNTVVRWIEDEVKGGR